MIEKDKVFAYITHGSRLLVFRHSSFPEAGIQVPGGTVEFGGTTERAIVREVIEETGLTQISGPRIIGEGWFDLPNGGLTENHHRFFFHFTLGEFSAATWRHWEENRSDGESEAIEFEFYWVDLAITSPDLIAGMDMLLPTLKNILGITN